MTDARVRVLLVDDDDLMRAGLKAVLSSDASIEVVGEAGNGRAAVERARALRPDLVLMDVRMPDLDGIETYKRLLERRRPLPCIFVTADVSPEVRSRAMDSGAFTIIPKPVRLDLLRFAMEEVLR